MVALHQILVVDPEPYSCPTGSCHQISKLIQSSLGVENVDYQLGPLFQTGPTPNEPVLVLLRSSITVPFAEALNTVRSRWNQAPVVGLFCGGRNTSSEVLQALRDGLDDFLCCPFQETDLLPRIQRLLQGVDGAVPAQVRSIPKQFHTEFMVGESPSFRQVIEKIPRLAHSGAPVLILGETGTGKELLAREIHYHSCRKGKPFIPVNCGALPDHLFENELFGHTKGAFTDASTAEKGLVAEAEGGTLFLDEVDTLSASAQVKLLRFLQDRMYRPLGSAKSIVADVRIITATNADLRQRVETRQFREDLYYRINILSLQLPPLRERIEDISLLAANFLARFASQYGRGTVRLSSSALQKLLAYSWLGNVRELEGVIQRAVVLASSSTLQAADIELVSGPADGMPAGSFFRSAKNQAVQQFERAYLVDVLSAHQGNITRAAKSAGKERRAFQRLLRKHGIDRCAFQS